jgi:Rrf2 family transcriptional regulator, nitric oxide-sensitive transcriptional repressor
MKLTKFTDYSLRVLIYLGVQPARRATIAQIASAFGVSENHLVKVVHHLGKSGWLASVRGNGGGLELARAPAQINVGQVVRRAEGVAVMAECVTGEDSQCVIAPCCRLSGVLGEATAAFYAVLERYTLADLVKNREQLAAVLFMELADVAGLRAKAAV